MLPVGWEEEKEEELLRGAMSDLNDHSICFLCLKNPANSEEHIIPASLGGRATCENFICEKCNNRLGNEIDSELELQIRPFSIQQHALTSKGEEVSALMGLTTPEGQSAVLHADHTVTVIGKPVTREVVDGTQSTILVHEDLETFAQLVVGNIIRDRLWERRLTAEHYSLPDIPGTIETTLNIGGDEAFRSVAKTGVALLCKKLTRFELDRHLSLAWARDFIVRGEHSRPRRFTLDMSDAATIRTAVGSKIGEHVALIASNWLSTDVIFLAHGILPYRVALSTPALSIPNYGIILNPASLDWRKVNDVTIHLHSFLHIRMSQPRLTRDLERAIREFNIAFPTVPPPSRKKTPISSEVLKAALETVASKPHRSATRDQILMGIEAFITAIETSAGEQDQLINTSPL